MPVDFEKQTLTNAFGSSGFDNTQQAFLSWLGVVQYLPRESVFSTLEALAALTTAGSELVFDYLLPKEMLEESDKPAMSGLISFTRRRGEPLASFFRPSDIEQEAGKRGFEVIENLSPAEQARRYFSGQNDALQPFGGYYIIHLRRIQY